MVKFSQEEPEVWQIPQALWGMLVNKVQDPGAKLFVQSTHSQSKLEFQLLQMQVLGLMADEEEGYTSDCKLLGRSSAYKWSKKKLTSIKSFGKVS